MPLSRLSQAVSLARSMAARGWTLALLMICMASGAQAAVESIVLVLSEDVAYYKEFAASFRAALDRSTPHPPQVRVVSGTKLGQSETANLASADLIIPVGVRATETVLRLGGGAPILATLVPRSAYSHLRKENAGRTHAFSAIYLDQPFSRQFALIRLALPERKRVGVLLGPDSADELRALRPAAREHGLSLASERVASEEELLPTLKRLLMESDVLLAVPDPLVFSRQTAQSILLTSYRAQDPLVAYSASYVSAGALLAVHSTPAQIARQAAELVVSLSKPTALLPAPQYPQYFSVSVNAQVARSMGIAIDEESLLLERLTAGERGRE